MKKQNIIILILVALTTLAFSALAELTKKERELAVSYLKETRKTLFQTVNPLTDDQLGFKEMDGSWSIVECVEHLALSEQIIFEWSQNALEHSAEKGEIAFQDEMLMKIFTDRSQKSKTLDVLEPKGNFNSIDEAFDHFDKLRAKHIEYIETTSDPLRSSYFDFPFGKGDAYQVILLLAAHTERHTKQIQEIMAKPGYPKSN